MLSKYTNTPGVIADVLYHSVKCHFYIFLQFFVDVFSFSDLMICRIAITFSLYIYTGPLYKVCTMAKKHLKVISNNVNSYHWIVNLHIHTLVNKLWFIQHFYFLCPVTGTVFVVLTLTRHAAVQRLWREKWHNICDRFFQQCL